MRFPLARSALSFLVLLFALSLVSACAGNKEDKDALPPDESVTVLYTRAMDTLAHSSYTEAAKQFAEVERQHPYSSWATHAQVMEAYANYQAMDYDAAVKALDEFIDLHPGNTDAPYAFYLRALCNYERIPDVRRDQTAAHEALKGLQDVITRFPDTDYARDAVLKIGLIKDHLAGGEMEVGRYYLTRRLYIAAIGRFRTVADKYQTTSHVPEALERLVECYVALGLFEEAQKNAALLGYNFPGSSWYKDAYALLQEKGVAPKK